MYSSEHAESSTATAPESAAAAQHQNSTNSISALHAGGLTASMIGKQEPSVSAGPPILGGLSGHQIMQSPIFTDMSAFDSRAELQVHNQVHMRDAKPYKCSHCPKTFANSSYLSQHMRIHLGVKPFGPCQFCSRKFTQLSHLQQHLRTHTGEKPYKCKVAGCEKAFSQLSNLQSHSRCHQSDKPYKCNSCYKCFSEESALLEHIPKHKDSKHLKIHLCPYCGKSYTQQTYLAKHMTKHADRRDRDIRLREMSVDGTWPPRDNAHICSVHNVIDSCADTATTTHLTFANQFTGAQAQRMMQQAAAQQNAVSQYQQASAAVTDPSSAFTHLAGLAANFRGPLTGSSATARANYFPYDANAFSTATSKAAAANTNHTAALTAQNSKHDSSSVPPGGLISLTDIQRYAGQTSANEQFSAMLGMRSNAYC